MGADVAENEAGLLAEIERLKHELDLRNTEIEWIRTDLAAAEKVRDETAEKLTKRALDSEFREASFRTEADKLRAERDRLLDGLRMEQTARIRESREHQEEIAQIERTAKGRFGL